MHDLQIYVPGRVAAKMISMVMNDVYTFLFNRYSSTCPTLRRTKQFRYVKSYFSVDYAIL
jgi:hypothetical protein